MSEEGELWRIGRSRPFSLSSLGENWVVLSCTGVTRGSKTTSSSIGRVVNELASVVAGESSVVEGLVWGNS